MRTRPPKLVPLLVDKVKGQRGKLCLGRAGCSSMTARDLEWSAGDGGPGSDRIDQIGLRSFFGREPSVLTGKFLAGS